MKGQLNVRMAGLRATRRLLGMGRSLVDPGPAPTFAPLFMEVAADNDLNAGEVVSVTFSPSDIDTANNRIYLPMLSFGAFTTYASTSGTPGEFGNSGGALPAALADASKQFFLSPEGPTGWYGVYKEPNATDWQTTPGGFAEDIVYPGQNFASQVNKLVLGSQGTGTHSFKTKAERIVSQANNMIAGKPAYNFEAVAPSDRNTWMEVYADGQGRKYFGSQRLCRDLLLGSGAYLNMGKTFFQKGAGGNARPELSGMRSVVMFVVMYADMTNEFGVARATCTPSGVNTTTGVFSTKGGAGHNFVTGSQLNWRLISGTMPGGYTDGGQGYVRAVNATTFTVHGSADDANNNASPIIPTTQGSGTFQFIEYDMPGDGTERMRFLAEISQPNGNQNTLSARYNATTRDATLRLHSDVTISGGNNGNCGIGGRTSAQLGGGAAVDIAFTNGAVRPIRQDTGLPMASGRYYQSLVPGSTTVVRYHDTLAQALAAEGVATSALTGPNACVKFTTGNSPRGGMRVEAVERPWSVAIVGGDIPLMSWSPPQREVGLLTIVVDYNDPSASVVRVKQYWNGVLRSTDDIAGSVKGNLATATDASLGTFLNSAASHVAWEGRVYRWAIGVSLNEITASDLSARHDWYKAKYGIA